MVGTRRGTPSKSSPKGKAPVHTKGKPGKSRSTKTPTVTPVKDKDESRADEEAGLTRSSRKRNVSKRFQEYMENVQSNFEKAKRRKTTISTKTTPVKKAKPETEESDMPETPSEPSQTSVAETEEATVPSPSQTPIAEEIHEECVVPEEQTVEMDIPTTEIPEGVQVLYVEETEDNTSQVEETGGTTSQVEEDTQISEEKDESPVTVQECIVQDDVSSYPAGTVIVENPSAIQEEPTGTIETEEAVESLICTQSNVEEEGVVIHSFVPQENIIVCESEPELQIYTQNEAVQHRGDTEIVVGYTSDVDGNPAVVTVEDAEQHLLTITTPGEIPSVSAETEQATMLVASEFKPHGVRIVGSNQQGNDVISLAPNQKAMQRNYSKSGQRVLLPTPVIENAEPSFSQKVVTTGEQRTVLPAPVPLTEHGEEQHVNMVIQTSDVQQDISASQVPVILSGDDQDTQALINTFMAENAAASSNISSADNQPAAVIDTPATTVTSTSVSTLPQRLKLTEQVQVDENGKEQTVVYLMTDDSPPNESPPRHVVLTPPASATQLTMSAADLQTATSTIQSAVTSADVSGIVSGGDTIVNQSAAGSQNEVVLEVLVDKGGYSKLQEVRVVNPYQNLSQNNMVTQNVVLRNNTEVYKCTSCDYKTPYMENFLKHVKNHKTVTIEKEEIKHHHCLQCSFKSKTFSNLKRHMLSHTDERAFACSMCPLRFKQKIHLQKHMNYIHLEKSVHCQYCDYVCANAIPDLKLHMKRKHLKSDPDEPAAYMECDKCGFLAASKKDLLQHSKFHKRGPELKLFCEHCSFVTDAKSRLERHKRTHTNDKPFGCPMCHYKASQKEHVYRHLKTKHGEYNPRQAYAQANNTQGGDQEVDSSEGVLLIQQDDSMTAGDNNTASAVANSVTSSSSSHQLMTADEEIEQQTTEEIIEQTVTDTIEQVIESTTGHDVHEMIVSTENTTSTDDTILQDVLQGKSQPQVINTTPHIRSHKLSGEAGLMEKKYTPPDYASQEKLFGCSHCTMKFVKLLSLYKHLHTQHSDLLPNTDDEKLTCVICDFKAPSHKGLLVHMRRHNAQDSADDHEIPGMLYVCVLCKYMNGKRRNLYQHLKKKHKISIMIKKDGTTSCVVEPNADVTVVASAEGQQVTEVVGDGSSNESTKLVNLVDLANSLTYRHEISTLIQRVDMSISDTETEQVAAEAIVDLASQNIIHTEVDDGSDPNSVTVVNENMAIESQAMVMEGTDGGQGQIEISTQQLDQLSSGDYIEINGETYRVEMQGDAMTAVLCEPPVEVPVDNTNPDSHTQSDSQMADHKVHSDIIISPADNQVTAEQTDNDSEHPDTMVCTEQISDDIAVDAVQVKLDLMKSEHLLAMASSHDTDTSDNTEQLTSAISGQVDSEVVASDDL